MRCADCIEQNSEAVRQEMACGYLPASDHRPTFFHSGMVSYDARIGRDEIKTCPWYTTNLPDVIDTAAAYAHYRDGGGLPGVQIRCGGTIPPQALMDGIEILKREQAAVDEWRDKERIRKAKEAGNGHR